MLHLEEWYTIQYDMRTGTCYIMKNGMYMIQYDTRKYSMTGERYEYKRDTDL